jgi:two-component system, OmpR family, sensor kinase
VTEHARSPIESARLRLPIRAKLATVSSGLTFMILCLFAVVIGLLADQRLHANFDDDLRATAADLQERIGAPEIGPDGRPRLPVRSSDADSIRAAAAGGAVIRVVDRNGQVIAPAGAPDLGPPVEGLREVGGYRVASRPLFARQRSRGVAPFQFLPNPVDGVVAFVQYGKSQASVNRTVNRVWLFLALGVLGGTALSFLAGLLVARRAMRPIAGLTRAAQVVARTRDPDITLPKPEANDEVAHLANTLEDMLGELGAARSETEATLARQRDFVADASHELRTPLTSILANLELLEAELAGEQREIAGSALRSSRRMRRLVADLLLLARADAGREAPRRTVDLAAVAREAVAESAPLATESQVALDAPNSVSVKGAPDDLHRMVLNLIENALIHTPQGTPVTVAVREEDNGAVMEVADRGPGIPASLRNRVFERFARGRGDSAPRTGGSGLGLAIVRAVAYGHGGSVELDNADGGGARFVVRLPRSEGEPAPEPPPRAGVPIKTEQSPDG